jgi:hypothetical protein
MLNAMLLGNLGGLLTICFTTQQRLVCGIMTVVRHANRQFVQLLMQNCTVRYPTRIVPPGLPFIQRIGVHR